MPAQIPLVDYLVLDAEGPHLEAHECAECGALFFDRRNACARCGAAKFSRREVAATGVLVSFTIVHRAGPGIPVPFVSAVVRLDGGGVITANLVGVEPDPAHIELGMPVRLTTYVAGTDDNGTEAVAFAFEPAG